MVIALYLARRASAPKAQVSVGHRIIVTPGRDGPCPEYLVFQVANRGERPLRITQLGWKVGLWRKKLAVQMYEESLSSKLPVDLTHGEEAKWFVPLAAREEPWLTYFAKDMLMPHYRTSCFTLRGQFFSSLGDVFQAKPEGPLLVKLRKACESLANNGEH